MIDMSEPLCLGIVQPWDCDVMGHFTVRRYAAAFDDASYQLIFRLGGGGGPLAPGGGLGWADVRQVYEYRAEMLPGTMFAITGVPVRLGNKSIEVAYWMLRSEGGGEVATMRSTLVRLDLNTRASVPIEAAMRERVEALLDGSAPARGGESG